MTGTGVNALHLGTEAAEDEHRVRAHQQRHMAGPRPRARAGAALPRPVQVA